MRHILILVLFIFLKNHTYSQCWSTDCGNDIYNTNTTGNVQIYNNLYWNSGYSYLSVNQGGSIELGYPSHHDCTPYIDFHRGGLHSEDFDTRIINSGDNQLDFVTNSGTTMRLNNADGYNYNSTLQFINNRGIGNLAIEFWSFGSNSQNSKFKKLYNTKSNNNGINSYTNMMDFYADYTNPNYDQFSIKSDGRCSWANDGSWFSNDQNGSIHINKGGYWANNPSTTPYIDFCYGMSAGPGFDHFSGRIISTNDNRLDFYTGYNSSTNVMSIINDGVFAKKITVQSSWSDFVFKKDYHLLSLTGLEKFVKENQHLPDIPTEQEVKEKGVELGEMASKLTQKIEELTLYVIDLNKEIDKLKKENEEMKNLLDNK